MPAGFLLRRAAGMKNGGALVRRDARQVQFFEHARRHGGNLRPVFDRLRCASARPADFPVGGVVRELEGEKLQREGIEFRLLVGTARCTVRTPQRGVPTMDGFAQTRGEAGKFFVHAVFVHGWFSATAESGFYPTFLLPQAWIYDLLIAEIRIINRHAKGIVQILDYSLARGRVPLFLSNQHSSASDWAARFTAWRLGWMFLLWSSPEDFLRRVVGVHVPSYWFPDLSRQRI